MDDKRPERLPGFPTEIVDGTEAAYEKRLRKMIHPWVERHGREPLTRSEWRDAFEMLWLGEVPEVTWGNERFNRGTIEMLMSPDNFNLGGFKGYVASRIPPPTPGIDERHNEVLKFLRRKPGAGRNAIQMRTTLSVREVKRIVPELESWKLIHRPRGKNSGYFITDPLSKTMNLATSACATDARKRNTTTVLISVSRVEYPPPG